jgi:hypothetical protein
MVKLDKFYNHVLPILFYKWPIFIIID